MIRIAAIIILMSLFVYACSPDDTDIEVTFDDTPYFLEVGNFPPPVIPEDNRLIRSRVELGRMLFYEKLLSKDGTQACADCHQQDKGFSDPRQFSIGVDGLPGGRHSMVAFNLAWHRKGLFWDGRSPNLRHQALQPIQDPLEMNESLENVVAKLQAKANYRNQFIRAFGDSEVTEERIGLALEQFMVTLVSNNSRFDKFLNGEITLTESEERGRQLFFGEFDPTFQTVGAECFHCHGGFNFTNDLFQNNGLDSDDDFTDMGRYDVTGNPADKAKFKTPTLRNIALTAPYMHDGRFNTLEEVIEFYNSGVSPSSTLDFLLQVNSNPGGLRLDAEHISDLVAFLHTLTDSSFIMNPAFSNPF